MGLSTVNAQQPQPGNMPNVPNVPNIPPGGGRDINGILQNAPVTLQPNQQGIGQRQAPLLGLPAPNPFDPHHARLPDQQGANNNGGQAMAQGVAGGQLNLSPEEQLLWGGSGGSYSSNMYGAVTVDQAHGMAVADVVRSAGSYNRDTAAAEVLDQKARSMAIDNYDDAVRTYFDIRQLNRRERNAERGPMPTQADAYRYSQSRVPERVSVAALDRQTGVIHWPAALMAPEFDEHRARLEQVFQGRSYYNSGIASQSYLEIRDEANRMLATLESRVAEMDPTAYIQAKKFVIGLGYEGRFLAGERVAMGG
jgi:hypothetical protein